MPTFSYQGIDKTGKRTAGEIAADDSRAAMALLKAQGLFPTEVAARQSDRAGQSASQPSSSLFASNRVSQSDLTILTRQLANLVASGIPLMGAFAAMTEHTENQKLRAVLSQMQQEVHAGKSLWEALTEHPSVFPPLYMNMVKAGEASGQLSAVLNWLADYLEKEYSRRMQIRSALAYPTLLIIFGTIAVYLLVTLVVPKFIGMFEEFDQALPLPTMVLVSVSHFFSRWGWGIIGVILLGIFGIRQYGATASGRYVVDSWKMRMPLFKRLGLKAAMSRFARTTATLMQGGVPLLETLSVVRDVLGNEVLARATDQAREGMREGERFADRLKATGVFPPLLTHMIGIGEETGDLRNMLNTVANTFDLEVDATVKSLVSMLEPVIIITVGCVMGFIIMAMLMPIFQINLLGT